MAEHTPWSGNLSVDLRKGTLSVSADGLPIIDQKGVCWGIIFPDKAGFYDHVALITVAVNTRATLIKALRDVMDAANDPYEVARNALSQINADVGSNTERGK